MSAPDVVITGLLTDAGGNPIAGTVVFTLVNSGSGVITANNGSTIVQPQISVTAATNGTWTATVWRNSLLTPATTFYEVQLYPSGSNIPSASAAYALNTAGTFAFSGLSPQVVSAGQPYLSIAGQPGPTGATGTNGAPGSSNVPYLDIQSYGGVPRIFFNSTNTTTAAGSSGSPTVVTLGNAKDFANGDGVCIWKGGNACAINNSGTPVVPSAPTCTTRTVTGSQTFSYKAIAVDGKGGLTSASSAGQVTNAPTIFGAVTQNISSISQSSGVVTVNFAAPLNATVSAGMTLHVTGFGIIVGDKIFNGVWPIASAPSTSQVTFALSGNYGSGTVASNVTVGRVSNVALIASISRDAAGLITVQTTNPHNFTAQGTSDQNQNVAILQDVLTAGGATGSELNGEFVIKTIVDSTHFTCESGIAGFAITGSVQTNGTSKTASTATSYEYIRVVCPAYSGLPNATAFFIYGDYGTGTYSLLGKTLPGQTTWNDWGPLYGGGFVAPGYVPSTPPASVQNQMFASTIISGGGSTSLTLAASVPGASSGYSGLTIMHDDGQALIAAIAAATAQSNYWGPVSLTPPQTPIQFPQYIINYPVSVPANLSLIAGCQLVINETLTINGQSNMTAPLNSVRSISPQFSIGAYTNISGIASPMIHVVSGQGGWTFDGFCIATGGSGQNGQFGVFIDTQKTKVQNCFFAAATGGTNVPLVYTANSWHNIRDCQFSASSVFGNDNVVGQSCYTPPVPAIWFRSSDTSTLGHGNIIIDGNTSFAGRGILLDGRNYVSGGEGLCVFGNGNIEYQKPTTPSVMCWGAQFAQITIDGFLNDSSTQPVIANWCSVQLVDVILKNCVGSGTWSMVSGRAITRLKSSGISSTSGVGLLGQNVSLIPDQYSTTFTTTANTSDTVTVNGCNIYSNIQLTPANSTAAAMTGVYAVATANTVTITHPNTANAVFYLTVSLT